MQVVIQGSAGIRGSAEYCNQRHDERDFAFFNLDFFLFDYKKDLVFTFIFATHL